MNRSLACCFLLLALPALCQPTLAADQAAEKPAASESEKPAAAKSEAKFLLKYRFKPGEKIRWQVEHQAQVKTTVSGTTQTADTMTTSIKVWKVVSSNKDGSATLVHSVESVDMRQKLTGRQEVRYNSRTDTEVPVGFGDVAKAVGVPLTDLTLSPSGAVIKRVDKQPRQANQSSQVTIPLPEEAVPVGHHWSVPYDTTVTTKDGGTRAIKLRQHMTLVSVKNGVATIEVENQVLTPVNDPTIDAQLVQSETTGKVRFDIAAGRLLSQVSDGDKSVVGFQGEASSMHYVTRFSEKLMPAQSQKKIAGPAMPSTTPQASKSTSRPAASAPAPSAKRTTNPRRR